MIDMGMTLFRFNLFINIFYENSLARLIRTLAAPIQIIRAFGFDNDALIDLLLLVFQFQYDQRLIGSKCLDISSLASFESKSKFFE